MSKYGCPIAATKHRFGPRSHSIFSFYMDSLTNDPFRVLSPTFQDPPPPPGQPLAMLGDVLVTMGVRIKP